MGCDAARVQFDASPLAKRGLLSVGKMRCDLRFARMELGCVRVRADRQARAPLHETHTRKLPTYCSLVFCVATVAGRRGLSPVAGTVSYSSQSHQIWRAGGTSRGLLTRMR